MVLEKETHLFKIHTCILLFMWVHIYACSHTCRCACVYMDAHEPTNVHVHVCLGGVGVQEDLWSSISLAEWSLVRTGWPASEPQGTTSSLPLHHWYCNCVLLCLIFSCGFWELNSDPHVDRASTLTTAVSPSPTPKSCFLHLIKPNLFAF
jgi:hypothetical protein